MRTFIGVVIFLLGFSTIVNAGQPSKTDTETYITKNMLLYSVEDNEIDIKYTFEDCVMVEVLTAQHKGQIKGVWYTFKENKMTEIPIKEVSFDSAPHDNNFELRFKCNEERCIKVHQLLSRDDGKSSDSRYMITTFGVVLTSQSITDKLVKALEHLRPMCGGEKELF